MLRLWLLQDGTLLRRFKSKRFPLIYTYVYARFRKHGRQPTGFIVKTLEHEYGYFGAKENEEKRK